MWRFVECKRYLYVIYRSVCALAGALKKKKATTAREKENKRKRLKRNSTVARRG